MFCKKAVLKNIAKFTGKILQWCPLSANIHACLPTTLQKEYSVTSIFKWILQIFFKQSFYRTCPCKCFLSKLYIGKKRFSRRHMKALLHFLRFAGMSHCNLFSYKLGFWVSFFFFFHYCSMSLIFSTCYFWTLAG